MKTIGQRIQERLNELNLGQVDLARKSGVSKPVISRVINNPERDLRATSLFAIATALQVDPVWLFTGLTGDEWQAKHGVSEAKASQLEQKQRKALPRLNRSKFYPRTFFN